jgi:exopolysaccharide production protein ExoY
MDRVFVFQAYSPAVEWRKLFRLGPSHQREIVFGFPIRLLVAIVSVVASAIPLMIIGYFTGWRLTTPLLVFFGGFISVSVLFGEHVRSRVYERYLQEPARPAATASEEALKRSIAAMVMTKRRGQPSLSAKRAFDLFCAIVGLIILSPLLLTVAALVVRDSPGPILIRQERVGFGGKKFWLLRFRTFYSKKLDQRLADDAFAYLRDDPRVTPIGAFLRKSSLDELPQLYNVLIGDMSIVGPRPFTPAKDKDLSAAAKELGVDRHSARPGLFSLSDVRQRRSNTVRETAQDDAIYLQARSMFLDLEIIVLGVVRALSKQPRI